MLISSKPIDPKFYEKLGLDEMPYIEPKVTSQRMGTMFDDGYKSSVFDEIRWFFIRHFKDRYYEIRHTIRNHIKWHKTLKELRPWNGDQMILCMITQLNDYIRVEENYGTAEKSYQAMKLASARETVSILERMLDPIDYCSRRRDAVEEKYPKYVDLISEYENGGSCYSGDFIKQGSGWAGIEAGNEPREGYFEKVGLLYELVDSPNPVETNRLLEQIRQYRRDINEAYEQAQLDSDNDFDRLAELLKENLYDWWD